MSDDYAQSGGPKALGAVCLVLVAFSLPSVAFNSSSFSLSFILSFPSLFSHFLNAYVFTFTYTFFFFFLFPFISQHPTHIHPTSHSAAHTTTTTYQPILIPKK